MKIKLKYPFSKAVKDKEEAPIRLLYGAPRIVRRRDDAAMEEVYAGPDPDPEDVPESPAMEAVYAGPGRMGKRLRRPAKPPKEAEMEAVYAGPEPDDEPREPVMKAVYAVPERVEDRGRFPRSPSGEARMTCVYAGPEQMARRVGPRAGEDAEPYPGPTKRCSACGTRIPRRSVFCPECGKKQPEDGSVGI